MSCLTLTLFSYYALTLSDHYVFDKIDYKGNMALLTARDSTCMEPFPAGLVSCANASMHIRQFAPLTYCSPSPPYNRITCKGQQNVLTFMENNGNLTLPLLNFYFVGVTNDAPYKCSFSVLNAYDLFDKDVLNELAPTDTLIVQTGVLTMENK